MYYSAWLFLQHSFFDHSINTFVCVWPYLVFSGEWLLEAQGNLIRWWQLNLRMLHAKQNKCSNLCTITLALQLSLLMKHKSNYLNMKPFLVFSKGNCHPLFHAIFICSTCYPCYFSLIVLLKWYLFKCTSLIKCSLE